MSYPEKMQNDGLCDPPEIEIPARQLLGAVCVIGGADCPLFQSKADAVAIIDHIRRDPTVTIRLASDADRIPHYQTLAEEDYVALDRNAVFDRKRDLDVLQRLGLIPGDTRRARYLYELLFERVETASFMCAYDTPGWEGCPSARSGIYESVRNRGWSALVYTRSDDERAKSREESARRIRTEPVLRVRPHHLMCMSCWYGATDGRTARTNDTLDVVWERISNDPDVEIMLVEGNCEACHCCDGFHPESTRCVHACGLIRDYKKDLDVFQKLGLMPGDRMNARELLTLLYERVPSTREICGYGDGIVTSREWEICGGSTGNRGYEKARRDYLAR